MNILCSMPSLSSEKFYSSNILVQNEFNNKNIKNSPLEVYI